MRQIKIHQNNQSLKLFQLTQKEIDCIQIKNTFNIFENMKEKKKINDFYQIFWSQKKVYLRDINSSYIIEEYDINNIYQVGDEFQNIDSQDYKGDKQINILFDLKCRSSQNQKSKAKDSQLIISTFDLMTFFYSSADQEKLINEQNMFEKLQNGLKGTFVIGQFEQSIQIKQSLEKLKQIEDVTQLMLYFKAYSLKYNDLENLLEEFCQQQNLSSITLNISFNNFSNSEMISLGEIIKRFQNLNSLKLILEQINSNEQGNLISTLLNKIAGNTKIEILDMGLEYNLLNHAQAQKICSEISRFPSLKILKLDLDQNELMNSNCSVGLFETISQIQSLIELDISLEYNQMTSDCFLSQKFQSIRNLSSLETLNISLGSNFMQEDVAQSIKEGVSKLQCLKKLSLLLQYLEIQENGLVTILQGVNECLNLEYLHLDLQKNSIGQLSISKLCEVITNLKNMNYLDLELCFTKINFEDALFLSNTIRNHKKLINIKFVLALQSQIQKYKMKRNLLKTLKLANSEIILL
ncbi:hypothetical protein ABPG74_005271 [Tetrahymena malaccensis]